MASFDDYIESTALFLSGFTTNQDQVTHLTNPVTTVDSTITVADGSVVQPGLIEINSELMWVQSVAGNVATLAPFGRAYRGTTATIHSVGDRVVVAPVIPRAMIERAVNDSIRAVYPALFGVSATQFTFVAARDTYPLPSGAVNVLSVTWDTVGPTEEWMPVRRWLVNPNASTTDFATGVSLSVFDPITPGRQVRVVYTHVPTVLSTGDDFTDSGLRDSCQDMIQFAAAARLVPWFDVGQSPGVSTEANYAAAMGRQAGAASLARYLTQMYQMRQAEEASALQSLFPVRSHYTR